MTSTPCETLEHDFKHLIRRGRANYECPRCGENVMILLTFAYKAGIDLTEDDKERK